MLQEKDAENNQDIKIESSTEPVVEQEDVDEREGTTINFQQPIIKEELKSPLLEEAVMSPISDKEGQKCMDDISNDSEQNFSEEGQDGRNSIMYNSLVSPVKQCTETEDKDEESKKQLELEKKRYSEVVEFEQNTEEKMNEDELFGDLEIPDQDSSCDKRASFGRATEKFVGNPRVESIEMMKKNKSIRLEREVAVDPKNSAFGGQMVIVQDDKKADKAEGLKSAPVVKPESTRRQMIEEGSLKLKTANAAHTARAKQSQDQQSQKSSKTPAEHISQSQKGSTHKKREAPGAGPNPNKKKQDNEKMRNILQEFNNSSSNLFKMPKVINNNSISSNNYSYMQNGSLGNGLHQNKTSFKKSGLTLDELRRKQARIQKMQRSQKGGHSTSSSQSSSRKQTDTRATGGALDKLQQKSEQLKQQNHQEQKTGLFRSFTNKLFGGDKKSDKSLDQSQISSAVSESANSIHMQPQDKPQETKSESTVISSTKNKTGSNSNEDEERKSGSLDIVDMSSEDFPERGAIMNRYSVMGNKNIDTIIEEQNDGDIGEDSIHQLVNPKGKGERNIRNPRAKRTGRILEISDGFGNNRESLYQSIYQSPNVEVDENYMKNGGKKDNKLMESIYDPGARSQSMYFGQQFNNDENQGIRATMKSFAQRTPEDKETNKKSYVYTQEELLNIIKRYEEAAKPIHEKRAQLRRIKADPTQNQKALKKDIKKYDEEINNLKEKRNAIISLPKLRRSIIHGLPCNFVKFVKTELPVRGEHGQLKKGKGQDIYVTECRKERPNIRKSIWMIICKIDDLKESYLVEAEEQRQAWLKKEKKRTKKKDAELNAERPLIESATQLYRSLRDRHRGQEGLDEIVKDITRADLGNTDFEKPCKYQGQNALFNVLNAYANYDQDIGYSQGMNIVVSWILKFMRHVDPATNEVVYDEENSYFILLHIMYQLKYRNVYDRSLSKTREHLQMIEEMIETGFPIFYEHLLEEVDVDLAPYFTNVIMTMFVTNLQDCYPEIASHIFDVFMVDGESVIFMLLLRFFGLKEEKLLDLWDNELMSYMREQMPMECLSEYSMPELLDFDAIIENDESGGQSLA